MRALILSCNTGEGHNSAACAIKEEFDRRGITCAILDALGFISAKLSRFVGGCHVQVYRHVPRAFRKGYSFSERHEAIFSEQKLIYRCLASGVRNLYDTVVGEKYDLLICTHAFSALMVSELRRRYDLNIGTCFVATDYTCSPSVAENDLDLYFIGHKSLLEEYEQSGIPRDKLIPSGIPVRRAFYEQLSGQEAKKRLGLAPSRRNLLLMCGSMGCGPVEKLAQALAEKLPENCDLTVVCGTNKQLYGTLSSVQSEHVHVLGYTDQFPLLLSASDLLVTKPGGLSITEAATKGTPMLFVDVVGGCEHRNLEFFLEHGWGETKPTVDMLAETSTRLLADPDLLSRRAGVLKEEFRNNSAKQICDALTQLSWAYEPQVCGACRR